MNFIRTMPAIFVIIRLRNIVPARSREPTTSAGLAAGRLFVGSPQQIVDKILYERELFGHQRFLAQIDIGGLPFAKVAQVIELFATKIAPVIRAEGVVAPIKT